VSGTTQAARSGTHHAVLAGFLGWTLDAFDFFIVVFLFDRLARQFGVGKKKIVLTTTATLAIGTIGAIVFGHVSQVSGRRNGLIVAFGLSLLLIPPWAFGEGRVTIVAASFRLRAGVQGACAVITVHSNGLSADRGPRVERISSEYCSLRLQTRSNTRFMSASVISGRSPALKSRQF
jgi:MFS family permease